MEDLSVFSSETTSFAASWLSQKPGSPIFASSSFLRACFAGRSKRVPDRNDPGREVFDRGGEVLVGQAHGRGYVSTSVARIIGRRSWCREKSDVSGVLVVRYINRLASSAALAGGVEEGHRAEH